MYGSSSMVNQIFGSFDSESIATGAKHSFSHFLDFPKVDDTLVSMKVVVAFQTALVEGGTPRRIDIGRLVAL